MEHGGRGKSPALLYGTGGFRMTGHDINFLFFIDTDVADT